jgi:hypothetical protein
MEDQARAERVIHEHILHDRNNISAGFLLSRANLIFLRVRNRMMRNQISILNNHLHLLDTAIGGRHHGTSTVPLPAAPEPVALGPELVSAHQYRRSRSVSQIERTVSEETDLKMAISLGLLSHMYNHGRQIIGTQALQNKERASVIMREHIKLWRADNEFLGQVGQLDKILDDYFQEEPSLSDRVEVE